MLWIIWVLIVLAALIVITLVYYFNKFVVLGNRINNSLSQIDVQLRKRADLVPNLMNTVKGYVKHEKEIFKQLTDARKAIMQATDITAKVKAGNKMQAALKTIFAMAESTPELKANQNFLQLQQELSSIEDKVAYSRQFYNDATLDYNNSIQTFPGNFFAGIFGKKLREFLQIPEAMRAVPKVTF
jgi:LemA protein